MSDATKGSDPVVALALARLGTGLRAGGVRVGTGQLLIATRALSAVDPADPDQARHALRAALCSRRDDLAVFDAVFAELFAPERVEDDLLAALPQLAMPAGAAGGHAEEEGGEPLGEVEPVPAAYSPVELLKDKDFADYTDAERVAARELIARLAKRGPLRTTRRTRPSRRRGQVLDVRATLRGSLAHGGEPIDRRWRAPSTAPRPLVLVCDVSGSMELYARMLLQYLHAAVRSRRRAEAFVFGTRLTRITGELRAGGRAGDPDHALRRASAAVADWQGGTRIGAALATLNREHGRRVGRGAVVVVLSDGWDRGEPELLAAETARLRRCAHRLVWCNPLKSRPGYEPVAQGMAAALPHVDDFLSGNSIASLLELAVTLEKGRR